MKRWRIDIGIIVILLILVFFFFNHNDSTKNQSPEPKNKVNINQYEKNTSDILNEKLKKDEQSFIEMEDNRQNIQKKLKKYYATTDDVKDLQKNVLLITIAKGFYLNSKNKRSKKLYKKASSILPKMETTLRYAFASSLEESFMKIGMNIQTTVVGKTKKTLHLKYALMSQPVIYQLQNTANVTEYAKQFGFKKVIFTNGFESYLGETWTSNL